MDTSLTKTMIDLFAGAGGLSSGLSSAGFSSLYANEVKKIYATTYEINNPAGWMDQRDIRDVDAKKIRAKLNLKPGELDLLAGGPPVRVFQ